MWSQTRADMATSYHWIKPWMGCFFVFPAIWIATVLMLKNDIFCLYFSCSSTSNPRVRCISLLRCGTLDCWRSKTCKLTGWHQTEILRKKAELQWEEVCILIPTGAFAFNLCHSQGWIKLSKGWGLQHSGRAHTSLTGCWTQVEEIFQVIVY